MFRTQNLRNYQHLGSNSDRCARQRAPENYPKQKYQTWSTPTLNIMRIHPIEEKLCDFKIFSFFKNEEF